MRLPHHRRPHSALAKNFQIKQHTIYNPTGLEKILLHNDVVRDDVLQSLHKHLTKMMEIIAVQSIALRSLLSSSGFPCRLCFMRALHFIS